MSHATLTLALGIAVLGSAACATSPEQQNVETLVDEAVALIRAEGDGAFADLRTADSKWFHDDTYLFVTTPDGMCLVHPAQPDLEGTDVSSLADADGRYPIAEAIEALQSRDKAWIDYRWPRPGATDPSDKSSFFVKTEVGGRVLIVGSGYYRN